MSAQRLLELSALLERMRACDEGMGMHCVDLLIEEVQPLVASLLADFGECQAHGYIESSHRCAFYSGQPLVFPTATVTAKDDNYQEQAGAVVGGD